MFLICSEIFKELLEPIEYLQTLHLCELLKDFKAFRKRGTIRKLIIEGKSDRQFAGLIELKIFFIRNDKYHLINLGQEELKNHHRFCINFDVATKRSNCLRPSHEETFLKICCNCNIVLVWQLMKLSDF